MNTAPHYSCPECGWDNGTHAPRCHLKDAPQEGDHEVRSSEPFQRGVLDGESLSSLGLEADLLEALAMAMAPYRSAADPDRYMEGVRSTLRG